MKKQDRLTLIEIYSGEIWQVKMMQSVLLEYQITTLLKNELMSSIDPTLLSGGGFSPASLWVNSPNLESAKKIIDDFNNGTNVDDGEYA